MSTTELFSQISLTEAAYANLTGLGINSPQTLLSDRLVAVDNGFSRTQADEFAKHWRVIHHQPDTLSGFSRSLGQVLNLEMHQ